MKLLNLEKWVFVKNKLPKKMCEVGIVFGGVSMIPHRLNKIIELYNKKLIKKILVTGGIGFLNKDRKIPEAYKIKSHLLKNNIPNEDILMEDKSRNTFENAKYSIELLKKYYDLNKIDLVLVTSDFHIKRCLCLISLFINKKHLYWVGVKDGKTDINNWKNSFYGKFKIFNEVFLINYYIRHLNISNI